MPPSDQTFAPERIETSSPLFVVEVMDLMPLNACRFRQAPGSRGVGYL